MANGQIITTNGKKIILDRTYNSSPTLTAPSQFKVGTGTTTPALSDTDLVTPVDIDGDNFKDFVSGYPTQDTTALSNTIRCFLNSLEANGNNLTEFGIVNADGTPLLFSRTVHTPISKSSSNEITYIVKDKIV
jgi:hypothetical protein